MFGYWSAKVVGMRLIPGNDDAEGTVEYKDWPWSKPDTRKFRGDCMVWHCTTGGWRPGTMLESALANRLWFEKFRESESD